MDTPMLKILEPLMIGLVVFMLGYAAWGVGVKMERSRLGDQAAERGYAEYNTVTGEWQWKEKGDE